MNYTFSSDSIQLLSPFKVKKDVFERELLAMREVHPECLVWNRAIKSHKREWSTYDAFYALGVLRKKIADTDLNWPQGRLTRVGYALAG